MIYNHRDFWTQGHGAKGLDPAILTDADFIEYDNGKRIPAFATSSIPSTLGTMHPHGPFREMSQVQAERVAAFERGRGGINVGRGYLRDVRADGVAIVVEPYGVYAPGLFLIDRQGSVNRVDAPYGDGVIYAVAA